MAIDRDAALAVLKKFGKAFNSGDVNSILECVTEDFEWVLNAGPDSPHGRTVRGREEVTKALAERMREFKTMRFFDTALLYADEHVIGTFRLQATRASGDTIDARGCDIYSFRDGRITRKDSYLKQITANQAAGAQR
jgi:ketosteroid isomerase-like protein